MLHCMSLLFTVVLAGMVTFAIGIQLHCFSLILLFLLTLVILDICWYLSYTSAFWYSMYSFAMLSFCWWLSSLLHLLVIIWSGTIGALYFDSHYTGVAAISEIYGRAKSRCLTFFSFICYCAFYGLHRCLFYPNLYSGTLLQFSSFVSICLDSTMVYVVALSRCGSSC